MSQFKADIKGLKKEWKNDPCWTLCETPGYKKHYDELKAYQEKCIKKWRKKEMILKLEKTNFRKLSFKKLSQLCTIL